MWTKAVDATGAAATKRAVCAVVADVDVMGIMAVVLNPQIKELKLSCTEIEVNLVSGTSVV